LDGFTGFTGLNGEIGDPGDPVRILLWTYRLFLF